MKYTYHIYSQILKYKNKDRCRFHMPGHKQAFDFKKFFPIAPLDVTELSYSDDLQCPTGAIKSAQEDIATLIGAKYSYITTDGSTSGVMAMLYVASRHGNKIIVPRNSHKSVFNACRLLQLEPVIVQGEECEGVLLPPEVCLIERLVKADKDIAGLIVTSPDYYGNVAPLEEYARVLKENGRLLFVDGAHGSHLIYGEDRPLHASGYADAWVDGAHKTLPTLTQGAVVSINNEQIKSEIEEGLSIFRTSSPSYPIMASVEYGVKLIHYYHDVLRRAKASVLEIKEYLKDKITFYPSADWTKIAVDFKSIDVDPDLIVPVLEKKGIYAELCDGRYIIFYASPMMEPARINELQAVLFWVCSQKKFRGTYKQKPSIPRVDRTYSYLYALKRESEYINLDDAVGKMSAENVGVSPPCVPVIVAGEIITEQAVNYLKENEKTFGVVDGKVKVVKK